MSAHGKCPHGQEASAPGFSALCASCVEAIMEGAGERDAWDAYERLKEEAGKTVNKLLNNRVRAERDAVKFLATYGIKREPRMTRTSLVMKVAADLYHRATGNADLSIDDAWKDTIGDQAIRDEYIRTALTAVVAVARRVGPMGIESGRCECLSQGLTPDFSMNMMCLRCGGKFVVDE